MMILQTLQTYLRTHPQTSLSELSHSVSADVNVVRDCLNLLIRKGRVRKCAVKPCGGCHSCSPESLEFYEWVNLESQGLPDSLKNGSDSYVI